MFQNDFYKENSNLSNAKLLSKIIINELDRIGRKKLILQTLNPQVNMFFFETSNKELKENILIEKRINEILEKRVLSFMSSIVEKLFIK